MVVGGGEFISDSGGSCWICFGWWVYFEKCWLLMGLFWVAVDSSKFILGGGGWWWIFLGCGGDILGGGGWRWLVFGFFWEVVGGGG